MQVKVLFEVEHKVDIMYDSTSIYPLIGDPPECYDLFDNMPAGNYLVLVRQDGQTPEIYQRVMEE